jgi:hypothetical protein
MKKYLLKTSEGLSGRIMKAAGETTGVICAALDLEVAGAAIAVSFNGRAPQYFGKSNREEILGAMKSLAGVGNRVSCLQEACGFGYGFHRELQAVGVESLVAAPEALNGRRKTDKRDVGKLCLLLVLTTWCAIIAMSSRSFVLPARSRNDAGLCGGSARSS